jgi:hypothetical protein
MSDDLVKRARHNALSDMPHYASVELIEALADRIEELERERVLSKAAYDGVSSLLLSVQQDCIKEHNRAEAAEAALKEAIEKELDAISTLDAWFDRRELGHAAVDQAVVDAASGYLRTSRCGGMPQEESDLILGVMQNMARLGLFADLFARAYPAELKGEGRG